MERRLRANLDDFSEQARADKLRLLYQQSFPSVFIGMVNAVLLATILRPHLDWLPIVWWLFAIFGLAICRLILFLGYRRSQDPDIALTAWWERPYFFALILSAVAWGLGGVWMMHRVPILQQVIIYCFLVGMAGGAISVYSAVQVLALAIVGALLVPATTWLLLQGTTIPVLLGVAGVLFLLSSVHATKLLSEALHRSFALNHQLKEAKERAEVSARTDFLTGLNNRGHFNELATMQTQFCQRHGYPVSMIVLDIDGFKKINDSQGHYFGDLALQHLAAILRGTVRSSDVCSRIGGEEFAILLPNTALTDAKTTAEKIRSTLEDQPVQTDDGAFRITVSLGVATGPEDAAQLLRMADKAMYRAKQGGRNQICHYDPQNSGATSSA